MNLLITGADMTSEQALSILNPLMTSYGEEVRWTVSRERLELSTLPLVFGDLDVSGVERPYWLFVVDRYPGANLAHPHDFFLVSLDGEVLRIDDVGYPPSVDLRCVSG